MNWAVGVEVSDGATEDSWQVTQDLVLILEDEQRPGRWPLKWPLERVDLVHGHGHDSFSFPAESVRIFKLVGSQQDRGRRLKSLTRGRFLVITPLDWDRDVKSGGHEFVAPEFVLGASWRAHHLEVRDPLAGPVIFRTPTGVVPLPQSPGFELEGDRLGADGHPDAGPLFRGSPPKLRGLRNITYRTVVVGGEGPRRGAPGWRVAAKDFEELRPVIADRRAGWFFVRLYDENDHLMDSLDFRFSAQLQAIELDAVLPIPGPDGHGPARVRLVHGEDCEVTPVNPPANGLFATREEDGHGIEIPPLPQCDETRWTIREGNGADVEICLRVDRLWWAVADEASAPESTEWKDRPLQLRADDVAATSGQIFRVRLPSADFASEVCIGVELHRSLAARPIVGRPREVQLPLRDLGRFADANLELKLWILPHGATRRWEVALARISAVHKIPEPRAAGAVCLHALSPVHVMTTLTRVRRRCGTRHKRMIDELRRAHYNPGRHTRHRDRGKREDFVRRALCLLAIIIEEHPGSEAGPLVAARWARRAQLARSLFPEVFDAVRQACPPAATGTRISPR